MSIVKCRGCDDIVDSDYFKDCFVDMGDHTTIYCRRCQQDITSLAEDINMPSFGKTIAVTAFVAVPLFIGATVVLGAIFL